MGRDKCKYCKYYTLDWSPIYQANVEGCSYTGPCRSDGCKDAYEKKEKPKAYIKRRV